MTPKAAYLPPGPQQFLLSLDWLDLVTICLYQQDAGFLYSCASVLLHVRFSLPRMLSDPLIYLVRTQSLGDE